MGGRARVTSAAGAKVVGTLQGLSEHVGVNSSPASSRDDCSLTILKQPGPAFAELLSTSTGFELQGEGAAYI